MSPQLPDRIPLRTKKVVRCRRDYEQNKLNILIQPKVLPLEGDSSLKMYRGKWWVKDGSAIRTVPSVTIVGLPALSSSQPHADSADPSLAFHPRLVLCISNPRDKPVFVSVRPTAAHWSDTNPASASSSSSSSSSTFAAEEHPPTLFRNILLRTSAPRGAVLPSSSSSSSFLVTADDGGLLPPLPLGAYEDELLRETDAEEGDGHDALLLAAAASFRNLPPQQQHQQTPLEEAWLAATQFNCAYVSLPIRGLLAPAAVPDEQGGREVEHTSRATHDEVQRLMGAHPGACCELSLTLRVLPTAVDDATAPEINTRVLIPLAFLLTG